MKKTITLLLFAVICIVGTTNAQRAQSTPIDELLNRLEQIGNNHGSISDYFTQEEQLQLRSHLSKKGVTTKTFSQNVDARNLDPNTTFRSSNITGTIVYNGPAGTATREAKGDQDLNRMPPVVITHSATQNIEAGAEIACANATRFTDNTMHRAFDLANDFGIAGDFNVTDAEIAIGVGVITPAGFPMTVNIYSSDSQDVDTATLTLLGTGAGTIVAADSETIVSIPVAATVPAGEIMVLEVVIIDDLTDSNYMRFGCNNDGETGPSWIMAPECGALVPTRFGDLGLTQGLVMNVVGEEAASGGGAAWCAMNATGEFGTFDPADGSVVTAIGPSPIANFENAGSIDPNDATTAYVIDNAGDAYSVDVATGTYTLLGNMPGDWTAGEFDHSSGVFYGIADSNLLTVDFGTLTATVVGPTGFAFGIGLAIDGAGNAYAYDVGDDNLYSVDLGTGATTLIGAIGFDANFGQGMFWDAASDTVLMTAFNNGLFDSELRLVDTATGNTTLINQMEVSGLTQYAWSSAPGVPVVLPPNDECSGAIDVNCGDVVVGETITATDSGDNSAPDLWYSFTGMGVVQDVTVSLCDGGTDYDSLIRIYDSCGGTMIDSNDDSCGLQSEITFSSDGTSTYYIMIEGFSSNSGNFSMAITCNPDDPTVPPNDECVDAIAVDCGDVVVGETITATDSGDNAANDLWYSYTGTVAGELVTVSFCDGGTDYDSLVRIYDSCGGTQIDSNDDSCGLQSEITFTSDGSSTYYIMVEGFSSNNGNFSMAITCSTSGIEANAIEGFNYYPNPVTDAINLSAQSNIETVAIYNVLGQKVVDQNVEATATTLNVSNLSVGTYIMKVSVDGQVGTYKIVKQ